MFLFVTDSVGWVFVDDAAYKIVWNIDFYYFSLYLTMTLRLNVFINKIWWIEGCGSYSKVASSFWVALNKKMVELITEVNVKPRALFIWVNYSIHYAFNFYNIWDESSNKKMFFKKGDRKASTKYVFCFVF